MSNVSHPDKNVILSIEESRLQLEEAGLPKEINLEKINEFYNSVGKNTEEELERDLENAFKAFDRDGDGFITTQELKDAMKRLGYWETGMDCNKMIQAYDTNSDGRIDFQEFKSMMKHHP